MPKILIGEIVQVTIYLIFTIVMSLTHFKKPLYFALGFVFAIAIPSILIGYGIPGRAAFQGGKSAYETFRALPIANAIWGIFHLVLGLIIFLKIKDNFTPGYNINTLLIALGFCFIYILFSVMLGAK